MVLGSVMVEVHVRVGVHLHIIAAVCLVAFVSPRHLRMVVNERHLLTVVRIVAVVIVIVRRAVKHVHHFSNIVIFVVGIDMKRSGDVSLLAGGDVGHVGSVEVGVLLLCSARVGLHVARSGAHLTSVVLVRQSIHLGDGRVELGVRRDAWVDFVRVILLILGHLVVMSSLCGDALCDDSGEDPYGCIKIAIQGVEEMRV